MIKKYGPNDNEVTQKILEEVGADAKMTAVIWQKRFENAVEIKNSAPVETKILFYADLRCLPDKIGTLEERLADISDRYQNWRESPDFENVLNACRETEKEIAAGMNLSVEEIADKVALSMKSFLRTEV